MRRTLLVATGLAFLMTGTALADDDGCNVPEAEWQPEQALRQKLETEGWKISEIEVDDGCYEVEGVDSKGREAEAYFDPKTFEVVKEG